MNPIELLSSPVCLKLALALLHFLWQGAVLGVLAWFLVVLFARKSARARYGIYMGTLFAMMLCVGLTFAIVESPVTKRSPLPPPELATPSLQPDQPLTANSAKTETPEPFAAAGTDPAAVAPAAITAPQTGPSFEFDWEGYAPIAVGLYFAGVLAMLARFLIGYQGGQRLRRHSTPVEEIELLESLARMARRIGLATAPAIAYCARVTVPTVVGVFKPTILLPLSFASGLSTEQVELLLCHELAHIRRWDPLCNVLQRVTEALLFFHPAVWILSRKIRIERENCCDDIVLATGGDCLEYATSLIETARKGLGAALPAEGLGATGKPSQLRGRVLRMMGGDPPNEQVRLRRPWSVLFVVLVIALALQLLDREAASTNDNEFGPVQEAIITARGTKPMVATAYLDLDSGRIFDSYNGPADEYETWSKTNGIDVTPFHAVSGKVGVGMNDIVAVQIPDELWDKITAEEAAEKVSGSERIPKLAIPVGNWFGGPSTYAVKTSENNVGVFQVGEYIELDGDAWGIKIRYKRVASNSDPARERVDPVESGIAPEAVKYSVIGRLIASASLEAPLTWFNCDGWVREVLPAVDEKTEVSPSSKHSSYSQRGREYSLTVGPNGDFKSEPLPVGKYTLHLLLREDPQQLRRGKDLAELQHTFELRESDLSESSNVFDLGTLELHPPGHPSLREPSSLFYGVNQATGRPDCLEKGDCVFAWSPLLENGGKEWIELEYPEEVSATAIYVSESNNPGSVYQINGFDTEGKEMKLWSGDGRNWERGSNGIATIAVKDLFPTHRLKLYLDTSTVPGWNTIDAVGIEDENGWVQWAESAKGSSDFQDVLDPTSYPREAPELVCESFEGDAINLRDERGHFVLLNFWTTQLNQSKQRLLEMAPVFEALEEEDWISVITVCFYPNADEAREFVKRNGLKGRHGVLPPGSDVTVLRYEPLPPTFGMYLIDPRGQLLEDRLKNYPPDPPELLRSIRKMAGKLLGFEDTNTTQGLPDR